MSKPIAGYDRPAGDPYASRSTVMAPHGMVATSQPLATEVGLHVLRSGGNAIDAAVAANAALGVVEPDSCGIGGDLFAIVWHGHTRKLHGLNASGRSPGGLSLDEFVRRGLDAIPSSGPLSWSVPGCVDGWHQLLRRFGTRPLGELLEPAIEYALRGFPVSEIISAQWVGAERGLKQRPGSAKVYLLDGRAPRPGEVFRNPALARSYRALAEEGAEAFYRGSLARRLVAYSRKVGGFFSLADFAQHRSDWVEPVSVTYRGPSAGSGSRAWQALGKTRAESRGGREVWELPPNCQGIAVLQMLNILEGFDLAALGHNTAPYLHLLIEAKKIAFEDRARHYADPSVRRPADWRIAKAPIAELLSKSRAEKQRALIDPGRALRLPFRGAPALPGADETVYLCAVDSQRNAVSLIQSNYAGFGSFEVPPDLGFCIQNRGCSFALDPNHANVFAPRKRPFHTIIPGFVTERGKPLLAFGVMGGDMQPQGHAQVLCNIFDFGMSVQEAGDAARFRHTGSSDPTGAAGRGAGTVLLESRIPANVRAGLRKLGHRVAVAAGAFGGYQAILIDAATGMLHGGTDPRKDGCAAGY
jgi:gamma-glutamyltranspeptidase/glutathione hydrolase